MIDYTAVWMHWSMENSHVLWITPILLLQNPVGHLLVVIDHFLFSDPFQCGHYDCPPLFVKVLFGASKCAKLICAENGHLCRKIRAKVYSAGSVQAIMVAMIQKDHSPFILQRICVRGVLDEQMCRAFLIFAYIHGDVGSIHQEGL